ncbi:hypothetical protein K438DRAFT_1650338 [Mycena galopus ATCC 62051]|nr:hypothetical protein K438DRAFT_1650338 [Mycena galopus ATCC 62051]
MSSRGGNSSAGKDYTVTNSGTNKGNHYCHRESSLGGEYHYSNRDGSYYYKNADGSTYYNNRKGSSTYTLPSGQVIKK